MNVDFSKISTEKKPTLVLRVPHEAAFGMLGSPLNVNIKLNYNSISEVSFSYSRFDNNEELPHYKDLEMGAIIDVLDVGQFIITDVNVRGNGVEESKDVACKSLEYELDGRRVIIPAGTYRLYNPVDVSSSVMGMALEKFPHWHVGKVDVALMTRYRTFNDTDANTLTFLRGTVEDLYHCTFEFDTYSHSINIVDRDTTCPVAPVHLSFGNVIKELSHAGEMDKYCTAYTVNGADGVDIREVNPIGENAIYNLDYPIAMKYIPDTLAGKWKSWQNTIKAQQDYFKSLVALRSAAYAVYLNEKATLTDLREQRVDLENRRSTSVQGLASAETDTDTDFFKDRIKTINSEIASKDLEIKAQEKIVEERKAEYQQHLQQISDLTDSLKKENFFTRDEMSVLNRYIYEGSLQDSSFAVFDVDVTGDKDSYLHLKKSTLAFEDISLVDVRMDSSTKRRIFDISGGHITISGTKTELQTDGSTINRSYKITAQLNHATIDHKSDGAFVMSAFVGAGSQDEASFPSGNITIACNSTFDDDTWLEQFNIIETPDLDDDGNAVRFDVTYTGDGSISIPSGNLYFTKNATDYQRYSVEQELYDYAVGKLAEVASPVYEFDIDSSNFLFEKEFAPFKDKLHLGYGIYLNMDDGGNAVIQPRLLGVEFTWDESSDLKLTFSNSFKRTKDGFKALNEKVSSATSSARSANQNQFKNGSYEDSGTKNMVKEFIEDGRLAAKLTVNSPNGGKTSFGEDGLVSVDETGNYQLVINNGMFALIDNATGKAVLGAGHFYNPATGLDFTGINAEVLAGDMILGTDLTIHTGSLTGDMQEFSVDANGVFLKNGKFYLDHDRGGKIMLDPLVGFAVGTKDLYTVNADGTYSFNQDNANLYIDLKGKLCLRDIDATGTIHGAKIIGSEIYIGGNGTRENCKFGVDASGNIIGLATSNGKLRIDSEGVAWFDNDVHIGGNLFLTGNITWDANSFPIKSEFSVSSTGPWHSTMQDADYWRHDKQYDGSWSAAYKFRGKDGSNGSDATVNRGNIVRAMLKAESNDGLYTYTIDGKQYLGINASAIRSGVIEGIDIYGGSFYDLNGKTRLELNPSDSHSNVADLILWGGGGDDKAFMIYDNMGSVTLSAYGNNILTSGTLGGDMTIAHGNWRFTGGEVDFSGTTVIGVHATFK